MAKIFTTGSTDGLGLLAAKDLINQGYEIHQTNIDGRFEIKNFPTDLM